MSEYRCEFCGEPVDPADRWVWHRVTGWERSLRTRTSGARGGSDIVMRERLEEFAHPSCVTLARDGLFAQESLL
jgi:hypothetical protein